MSSFILSDWLCICILCYLSHVLTRLRHRACMSLIIYKYAFYDIILHVLLINNLEMKILNSGSRTVLSPRHRVQKRKGREQMKAITVWQPWAGALAAGIKENETRGWATKYRGPIAIHAAMKPIQHAWWYADDTAREVICRRLDLPEIFYGPGTFPTGYILATAELVDCIRITPEFVAMLSADELALGDYTLGRYAWKMANVQKLPEPIQAKGRQGLWNWEPVALHTKYKEDQNAETESTGYERKNNQ